MPWTRSDAASLLVTICVVMWGCSGGDQSTSETSDGNASARDSGDEKASADDELFDASDVGSGSSEREAGALGTTELDGFAGSQDAGATIGGGSARVDSGDGHADSSALQGGPTLVNLTEPPEKVTVGTPTCQQWAASGYGRILSTTSQGDIFIAQGASVSKCGADAVLLTSTGGGATTTDADGSFYFAFEAQATGRSDFDIALEKFSATGTKAWSQQESASDKGESVSEISVSGSHLYLTGTTPGQLPGQPATSAGRPFLIKYSSTDGKRVWIRQPIASDDKVATWYLLGPSLISDKSGNAYVLDRMVLAKFDANGERVWETRLPPSSEDTGVTGQASPPWVTMLHGRMRLYLSPDERDLYIVSLAGAVATNLENVGIYSTYILRFSDRGDLRSFHSLQVGHRETIDPVEGVTWSGSLLYAGDTWNGFRAPILVVRDSDLFLISTYSNTFKSGSTRPPDFEAPVVYKLRRDDYSLVWARQYTVGDTRKVWATFASATGTADIIVGARSNSILGLRISAESGLLR